MASEFRDYFSDGRKSFSTSWIRAAVSSSTSGGGVPDLPSSLCCQARDQPQRRANAAELRPVDVLERCRAAGSREYLLTTDGKTTSFPSASPGEAPRLITWWHERQRAPRLLTTHARGSGTTSLQFGQRRSGTSLSSLATRFASLTARA